MLARKPAFRPQCEQLEAREVPAFGAGGIAIADIGLTGSDNHSIAIQSDGKLVTAGGNKVARFNVDGSLDITFNGTGVRTITGIPGNGGSIADVAVMADGRIVVGGVVGTGTGNDAQFYLERFLPNGTPDPSFSGDGVVVTGFKTKGPAAYDNIHGIALQGDGKIVSVGEINGSGQWGVARFNVNGTLDTTFSGDGWLTDEFDKKNTTEFATAVAVQTDGKIVVRGNAYRAATSRDVVVVRYNANGTLDTSFGTGGKAWIDFGAEAGLPFTNDSFSHYGSLQLDPSGHIVVESSSSVNGVGAVGIARLTSGGVLDTSFSGNGLLFATPAGWRGDDNLNIAVQSDGVIVVTYYAIRTDFSGGGTLLGRINSDGTMDTSFDEDGWRLYAFAPINSSRPTDVLIQPDGKIVVVGWCHPEDTFLLGLARFNDDGSYDV